MWLRKVAMLKDGAIICCAVEACHLTMGVSGYSEDVE